MSQQKVDKYKEQKKNRKAEVEQQKKNGMITKIVCAVIACALVVWLGYSVYNLATRPDNSAIELDTGAMYQYLEGLDVDAE